MNSWPKLPSLKPLGSWSDTTKLKGSIGRAPDLSRELSVLESVYLMLSTLQVNLWDGNRHVASSDAIVERVSEVNLLGVKYKLLFSEEICS